MNQLKFILIIVFLYISYLCIKRSRSHYLKYKKNKQSRYEAITSGAKKEMRDYGAYIEDLVFYKINELDGITNLLRNVCIDFNGYKCEFDAVFFHNKNMFVIEVKGYSGELYKGDHGEIIQNSNNGVKTVRNPYSQLRRAIGILKRLLTSNGVKIWIDELVIIPTEAEIDKNIEDSVKLIRTFDDLRNAVSEKKQGKIEAIQEDKIVKILNQHSFLPSNINSN